MTSFDFNSFFQGLPHDIWALAAFVKNHTRRVIHLDPGPLLVLVRLTSCVCGQVNSIFQGLEPLIRVVDAWNERLDRDITRCSLCRHFVVGYGGGVCVKRKEYHVQVF